MKWFFLLFLVSMASNASSQYMQYANGEPFVTKSYEEYKGSPFLFEHWAKSKVLTSTGKLYDSIYVNLDMYSGILLFLRDGKPYSFVEPVAEFSIQKGAETVTYKSGKRFNAALPDLFFTTISTKPLIVKANTVNLIESPAYGNATKQYRFVQGKVFYDVSEGTGAKVNLTKGDAEKVFKSHWAAINEFATKNKISFKTEEGWNTLAKHYQTLVQLP